MTSRRKVARAGMMLTLALAFICIFDVSCKTGPGSKKAGAELRPLATDEFVPATYISPLHLGKGPYPNLFSPESFALWVGNDVTALRRAHAVEKGESIDPGLDAAAKNIDENFLVFECSFSSAFGDMSIAYDVVGLRGMSVYLATADGKRIDPVEVVLASSAREEPREALRNFTRTSMVFFPKRDIARNVPVLDGKEGFVRLVVENYNTVFYFEWAPAKAKAAPWVPNKDEYLKAVKTGFNEFFGCVKNIVHATQ